VDIRLSPEAEADFASIVEYIAQRDLAAAARLSRRIFELIDKLADRQFEGPEHTLQSGERVYSWPVPPFRIYYRRHGGALWIVRLYHQVRSPIAR